MPMLSFQFQSHDALKRHLIASAVAIGLFIVLFLAVQTVPELARWDASVADLSQLLRSAALDRIMIGITLLGDFRLAVLVFIIVLSGLLYQRFWWLTIHLLSIGLSAMLSVSIIKFLLQRQRPDIPAVILDSFSFPSGHACTAVVTWGLLALLLAQGRSAPVRWSILAFGFTVAVAVAFSRVYLQAHWPTDVLAGLALGLGLLLAFAWQLHICAAQRVLPSGKLLGVIAVITAAYLFMNYHEQAVRYSVVSDRASLPGIQAD